MKGNTSCGKSTEALTPSFSSEARKRPRSARRKSFFSSGSGDVARSEAWGRLIDLIKTNCPPELNPKAGADTWPRDLLRHSFGTYCRAKVGSLTQIADQIGNSVAVCNKHYSRPVLQAEGEAYFNIWPDGKEQG